MVLKASEQLNEPVNESDVIPQKRVRVQFQYANLSNQIITMVFPR